MTRPVRARIDEQALRDNLRHARGLAPASRILAVIKADGYGHGLARVARALDAADAFGVACLEEALALRDAGVSVPIVLLAGVFDDDELGEAARLGIEPVVHHEAQLAALEAARLERPLTVWLKVDTGMHRLGFAPEAAAAAWRRLNDCSAVASVRLMTHLACADERGHPRTAEQVAAFERALEGIPGERSIANSGALLSDPALAADWTRPGLMLYGASPFNEGDGAGEGLRPAMTFETRLIAVNHLRRGDPVGYGGSWTCPEDMPVGVAAAGYGDGYPRHAPSGTPVLVNGARAPLVGRVSMDMVCIDLRAQPDARPGAPVTLWGEGLPVEEVARAADTIPYELLCGVTRRVPMELTG